VEPKGTWTGGAQRYARGFGMRDELVDRIMQTIRAMKDADFRRRQERPGTLAYQQAERDVERYADRVFGLGQQHPLAADFDDGDDENDLRLDRLPN
jgi:hypothetical protein